MIDLLQIQTYELWHPDSPGMKVLVRRSWIGRLFKPTDFATLSECQKEQHLKFLTGKAIDAQPQSN